MSILYPEEGKDGKTERGTAKKREEARKDGKLVCSNEINTVAVLAAGVVFLRFLFPYVQQSLTDFLQHWSRLDVTAEWNVKLVQTVFLDVLKLWLLGGVSIGCVAVGASVMANIVQTGPYFSTKVLEWKFDSLNPVSGFKQLFSKDSIVKLGLSLMKVGLIAMVIWFTVRKQIPEMASLYRLSLRDGLHWYMLLLMKVIYKVLVLYILIAALDWIKEKRKFEAGIMMKKQEVKDEHKNQDGNPQIKRQQRKKMQELSMSRMMAAVPDASVVITNPTYLAIAVKYDAAAGGAPVVVAKGKRLNAKRIRKIAAESGVPILERKPLARAMYARVKIGQPVPPDFYEAVAELLAYLYRMGNERIRQQLGR